MNFTPQQKHSLLSKMGYNGPVNDSQMENFMRSNPGAAAKMGKFDRAMKRGFQTGGAVIPPPMAAYPTSEAKTKVSEAMGKLSEAERIAAAWSIAGIETKEDTVTIQPITPSATTPSATTPSATTPPGLNPKEKTALYRQRQGRSKGGIV